MLAWDFAQLATLIVLNNSSMPLDSLFTFQGVGRPRVIRANKCNLIGN